VVGNRAYVATQDDKMGIIDISIPTNPAYMGYIAHGTDNAYLSNAKALHVQGNYAYVVSNGTSALEIIDITNSLLPAHVGTMLDAGNQMTFPEDIFVVGNYAYIASQVGLTVVDVTDPANPQYVTKLQIPFGPAIALDIVGSYAYIGGLNYFAAVDITD